MFTRTYGDSSVRSELAQASLQGRGGSHQCAWTATEGRPHAATGATLGTLLTEKAWRFTVAGAEQLPA